VGVTLSSVHDGGSLGLLLSGHCSLGELHSLVEGVSGDHDMGQVVDTAAIKLRNNIHSLQQAILNNDLWGIGLESGLYIVLDELALQVHNILSDLLQSRVLREDPCSDGLWLLRRLHLDVISSQDLVCIYCVEV